VDGISAPIPLPVVVIHLGEVLPLRSSDSTRKHDASRIARNQALTLPYLVLLRLGFTKPASHPAAGEAFTSPFHLSFSFKKLSSFLWHFPPVAQRRR